MGRASLAWLAAAFALGTVLTTPCGPNSWFGAAAAVCAVTVIVPWLLPAAHPVSMRPVVRIAVLLALFAICGHLRSRSRMCSKPLLPVGEVECGGIAGRARGHSIPLRDAWCRSVERRVDIDAVLPFGAVPPLPGTRILLAGHVRAPGPQRNPGDRDVARDLRLRGVSGQVFVQSWATELTASSRILSSLSDRLARDRTGLVAALLLGLRGNVSADQISDFRRAGLAHLLALSGLHVLFVGFAVSLIIGGLLARTPLAWIGVQWARVSLTVGFLGIYAWVTGAAPSVSRAVIMTSFLLARPLARRAGGDPWNALGAAALVVLWMRPMDIHDLGFRLSFCAVASLLTFTGDWKSEQAHSAGKIRASLVASWSVTLGTFPMVLSAFGRLPMGAVLMNLPAIPLAAAVVVGGLATLILPAPLSDVALSGATWCADWLRLVAAVGTHLPAVSSSASNTVLAALVLCGSRVMRHQRAKRVVSTIAMAVLCVPLPRNAQLDVVMLDVGQGDATLVVFPSGSTMLVDTGPPGNGSRIARTLRALNASRLDAVVITHPHDDHDGSLEELAMLFPDARLYGAAASAVSPTLLPLSAGDNLLLDSHVRVQVLAPDGGPSWSVNDESVVLRIAYGSTTFLLTGDIEEAGERAIVARFSDLLRADVIKIPHHGSRTSSSPPFINVAAHSGSHGVISVGDANRYRLPNPEVTARWNAGGATVMRTDRHGALWFRSDGRRVARINWRD